MQALLQEDRTPDRVLLAAAPNRLMGGVASLAVLLFTSVLLLYPDRLFADDSYFYFQVAWNFARGMGSTFNTIMPTNGYHPVWMLVCAAVFKAFPEKIRAIHAIAGVIALIQALTLLTVRRVVQEVADDLWPIAFLLLMPFCFASQLGTEGPLSGLFLALAMLLAYRFSVAPTGRLALLLSLAAAFAVLTRLDNIFVVGLVLLAGYLAADGRGRRLLLLTAPVLLVLWGGYVASNWIFFGTIQPISGLLKSHSTTDHRLGANLPHTAMLALAIIVPSIAFLAIRRRDRFFRTVELPFAAGVLVHAAYIVFRMSSETRWSWYYTSWVLLASVLLARVASVFLERRRSLVLPVCAVCVLLLLVSWYTTSYRRFYAADRPVAGAFAIPPPAFNEVVYKQAGLRRVLAYDQPGALAFYSDLEIVPLDGLMGSLKFQQDLARDGIAPFIREAHIDGFIGPAAPLGEGEKITMCDQVYLSTEQFHCVAQADHTFQVVAADVYARVPAKLAGTVRLDPDAVVWHKDHYISVWRLTP